MEELRKKYPEIDESTFNEIVNNTHERFLEWRMKRYSKLVISNPIIDELRKEHMDISISTFDSIFDMDPTEDNYFTGWLLKMFDQNLLVENTTDRYTQFSNDPPCIFTTTFYIREYLRLKQYFDCRPIESFNTVNEFVDYLAALEKERNPSSNVQALIDDRYYIENKFVDIHAEDDHFLILTNLTYESFWYYLGYGWLSYNPDECDPTGEWLHGRWYIVINKQRESVKEGNAVIFFNLDRLDFSGMSIKEREPLMPYFNDYDLIYKAFLKFDNLTLFKTGDEVVEGGWVNDVASQLGELEEDLKANKFLRATRNEKWGFVDKDLNEIIPVEYDEIKDFQEGYAIITKNSKSGLINEKLEWVIPIKYEALWLHGDGIFTARLNDLTGCINVNEEVLLPFKYDDVKRYSEEVSVVKVGKWGCVDRNQKVIVPTIFDNYPLCMNGYIIVEKDEKYGCYNYNGEIILNCEYEELQMIKLVGTGSIAFLGRKGNNSEVLDSAGNSISGEKSDKIRWVEKYFEEHERSFKVLQFLKDNEWVFFTNKNGNYFTNT